MVGTAPHSDASYLEDSVSQIRFSVCTSLQMCLVDLVELQLQAKQAHWNLAGKEFRSLHLGLDDTVDAARRGADGVAERIRALDGVADGRSEIVSASTTLTSFPGGIQSTEVGLELIIDRLTSAAETLRAAQSVADRHDPPSSDLLNGVVLELEKQRWMFRAEGAAGRGSASGGSA